MVALVAALAGTAFAAAGLNSKQKKEVKKIAKKFAGKRGPAGPAGAAGPQGAKGDTGAAGKDGANGTNGTNGTNGKSVVVESVAAGTGSCSGLGGAKFHQEGSGTNTFACNGESGFTETLPSGETETGVWGIFGHGSELVYQELSFNIPLAEAPEEIVYNQPETTKCPGTADEPTAAPGILCLYFKEGEPAELNRVEGLDRRYVSGAQVAFTVSGAGKTGFGTWAVTAK